jgi:hypothetical protein
LHIQPITIPCPFVHIETGRSGIAGRTTARPGNRESGFGHPTGIASQAEHKKNKIPAFRVCIFPQDNSATASEPKTQECSE